MAETALLEIKNVYDTLSAPSQAPEEPTTVTMQISGPTCPACSQLALYVSRLTKAIADSLTNVSLANSNAVTPLTGVNICAVCIDVMKVAAAFSDITLEQRKSIVIQAFSNFIKANNGDQTLLDVVPSFVNAAVDLSNGTITLEEIVDVTEGCCIGFCTTLRNKKST